VKFVQQQKDHNKMLYEILIVIYLIVALMLIGLVLIQQGKGADMGASFGAGSSNTVFGSSGSGNFLTKSTSILAVSFFVLSLVLGNLTANRVKATDEWKNLATPTTESVDVAPAASAEPVINNAVENTDVPVGDDTSATQDNGDVPN
jgi:preprotein translocase subunit SecG